MANKPSWVQDPSNPNRYTYTDVDGSVYESISNDPVEGIDTDAETENPFEDSAPAPTTAQPKTAGWVQDASNPNRYTYTDTDGSVYESISEPKAAPAQQTPKVVAPVAAPAGQDTSLRHDAEVAARGGALGFTDVAGLVVGNPVMGPLAPVMAALKSAGIDVTTLPSETLSTLADSLGFGKPETTGERYLEAGSRGLTGGLIGGGAGLANLGLNVVGGVTGGLSAQAAKEGGYGEGVQLAAGLVGGLAGGVATARALKRFNLTPEFFDGLKPEERQAIIDEDFAAETKARIKAGQTRAELDAFAEQNGKTAFGPELDAVIEAQNTNRPWGVKTFRKQSEEKAVKATTKANPDDVAGELQKAGVDPSVLEKNAFTPMKDRPKVQQQARVEDINQRIEVLTEGWTNKPEFEVVHSIDDIADDGIRQAAIDNGAKDGALGFFGPDGKIRIVSENIQRPEDLAAVVFHEGLGHYGLQQKFGDDLTRLMNDFYEGSSGDFRTKVDDWITKNPDYYKGQENPHLLAAEEVLAEMSERGAIPAEFRDRLINHVKTLGRTLGVDLKYSDREIGTILGMSHDAVIKGFGRDVAANGFRFARAYHGTGEAFSDYDVSRAGQFNSEKGVTYFDTNPRNADTYAENSLNRGSSESVGPVFDRIKQIEDDYPDWRNRPASIEREMDSLEQKISDIIDGVGTTRQNIRPVDIDIPESNLVVMNANGGRILKDVREAAIRKAKAEGKKGVLFKNAIDTSTNELRGGGEVKASDVYALFDANADTKPGFGPTDGLKISKTNNGIRGNTHYDVTFNHKGQKVTASLLVDQNGVGDISIPTPTGGAAKLGPAVVRQAANEIRRQIPEIKSIKGMRETGARAGQDVEGGIRWMRRRRREGDVDEPTGAMMSGNINLDRLQTSRDVSGLLDNLAKNAPTEVKSWAQVKAEARELNLNPTKVSKDTKGVGNLSARLFAYRQIMADTLDRTSELEVRLLENYNAADHANYLQKMAQLETVRSRVSNDSAEIGRALSSLRLVAQSSRRSSEILEALAKSNLTMASLADPDVFMRFMKNVQALKASGNPQGAANLMSKVVKPYWEDYVLSGRHSLMLSGLGTHYKNIRDNMNMIAREYIEAGAAVPMGGVAKEEMAARTYGLLRAALDSTTYKDTYRAFKEGVGNTTLNTKTELESARIPVLSKVGDLLNAEDVFFRKFMETSNIYAVGVREARKLGFKGKDLFDQGSHLAQNPTEDMLKEARSMADVSLLVSEPSKLVKGLETIKARKVEMGAGERTARFVAHLAFPFLRTTENLLFQKLRRSPLSFMDARTREDFVAGGARRATAVSRTLLGTAIIGYYIHAANEGDITGGEKNYKKVQALEPGGYKPNSTVSPEKYTDATALNTSFPNPFGLDNATAAAVATLVNTYNGMIKTGRDKADAYAATLGAFISVMGASSFAQNMEPYMDLLKADQEGTSKKAAAAGGLASQFVPALGRQMNNALVDTQKRDYTGDRSFGDRVSGQIQSGIPGLSDDFPLKYDVYGQEIDKGANVLGVGASKKRPTDPTIKEMVRVEESLDKPVITAAPRNLTIEGMKTTLIGENYAFFQKTVGENLRNIMSEVVREPGYKRLTDKEKREVLREAQTEARKAAKEAVLSRLDVSDFKDVNEDK